MPTWRRQILSVFLRWHLRPWALLTPLLVLLIALPMLRPLRAPGHPSRTEQLLLDTVSSVSRDGTLAVSSARWAGDPQTVQVKGVTFADRPPTFAVLLAGPAWVLTHVVKLDPEANANLIAYLLTFLGTTLPVALGGGIIYRMGRLFELSRPKRALLALLVTFGGGWISYATVLNPHAPAAAALVGAIACLLVLAAARRTPQILPITLLSGLLAAMAAALSPWTLPLVLPLPLVLFATTSLSVRERAIGFLLMTIGAMPIAWMHTVWSLDAFGSPLAPGSVQTLQQLVAQPASPANPLEPVGVDVVDAVNTGSLWGELFNVTLGNHGFLTHFPLVIVGFVGMFFVLRKHWPTHAKMLAGLVFVGMLTVVMLVAGRRQGLGGWMFGVQWFVVFLPLLAFFAGAVMRRRDLTPRGQWAIAAAATVSVIVSVAGAGRPLPETDPYRSHTALGAVGRWFGSLTGHDYTDAASDRPVAAIQRRRSA